MSTIIAKNLQIGRSNTPSENFTLAVPSSPNGTMKLSRGNSGATTSDILTIDSSGNISITGKIGVNGAGFGTSGQVLTSGGSGANPSWTTISTEGLGVGQTWTDVTASRALSTTYTNSTGKPIQVSIVVRLNTNNSSLTSAFSINGVSYSSGLTYVASMASYQMHFYNMVIPNNATYSVTGGTSIYQWSELR
jgi:hypothetical protein